MVGVHLSPTVLITGATDGLGRALAARAHAEGWDVLAHGRSEERLAALAHELDGVRTFRADLASLTAVEGLAAAVLDAVDRLDVLVGNAGIGSTVPGEGKRMESTDGHELRFAVNYLAEYGGAGGVSATTAVAGRDKRTYCAYVGQGRRSST